MTEAQLNSITLWILLPSLALFFILIIIWNTATPRFVRRRRYRRQLVVLENDLSDRREQDCEIDWLRFKEIPKVEIRHLLSRNGWRYVDEQIGPTAWSLRFTRLPVGPDEPDARTRLRAELAAATASVDGGYQLDTEQYGDLQMTEIKKEVNAAGWLVARLEPGSLRSHMVLTRKGTTVLAPDPTFLEGRSTAELRESPAVVERAGQIKAATGVDPLSERQLNETRTEHQRFQQRFNRWVALASGCVIVGGVLLLGLLNAADLPPDEAATYVLLGVPTALLLVAVFAVYRAVRIRRAWRKTTDEFRAARAELDRIYERG